MVALRWSKPFLAACAVLYVAGTWVLLPQGWSGVRSWLMLTALMMMASAMVYVWTQHQRERWVREAPLPQFLKRKVRQIYPHLNGKDMDLVERGLRQFFMSCLRSNKKFVAMPSRAVDAMWHEFILHTKGYKDWCSVALGRFLHHTPAEALGAKAKNNDGLRRAWYWCCKEEGIDPRAPTRLPLLFALDAKLQIPNGFHYVANCADIHRKNANGADDSGGVYCGTDFSDDSYVGEAESLGGSSSTKDGSSAGDCIDGSADGCSGSGCGGD